MRLAYTWGYLRLPRLFSAAAAASGSARKDVVMFAADPFPKPMVSVCVRCASPAGRPFGVVAAGPRQLGLRFRCQSCWAEWAETWVMPESDAPRRAVPLQTGSTLVEYALRADL